MLLDDGDALFMCLPSLPQLLRGRLLPSHGCCKGGDALIDALFRPGIGLGYRFDEFIDCFPTFKLPSFAQGKGRVSPASLLAILILVIQSILTASGTVARNFCHVPFSYARVTTFGEDAGWRELKSESEGFSGENAG
jgi:hypothetical protein